MTVNPLLQSNKQYYFNNIIFDHKINNYVAS